MSVMTKKEFIEILKKVQESFKNNIFREFKEKLGLVDDVQLLPFEDISPNSFSYGYYWKDNNGEWRVNMFLDEDQKDQAKVLENKKGIKFTNHREREEVEKENNIPHSREVRFEMKCIPDSYDFPSIIIDDKTLFNICQDETPGMMATRWNKSVLEHYKGKQAKKYREYEEPFYEWFEDDKVGLSIDSDEYKAIPLLYDEQPEKEAGGETKKEIKHRDSSLKEWAKWDIEFNKLKDTPLQNRCRAIGKIYNRRPKTIKNVLTNSDLLIKIKKYRKKHNL